MYKILIKFENKIANLWQVYGSTTAGTSNFTEFVTDDINVLEATVLELMKEMGSENIRVVKELPTEYVVDITVEDVENEEVTP